MKTYLYFEHDGNISEMKSKNNKFDLNNFTWFDSSKQIEYLNKNYIIIYNSEQLDKLNKCNIPFTNVTDIFYGDICIFSVNNFDDLNLESFTFNKYYKFLDTKDILYFDYSSDDFSPDTCEEKNNC
tara:strand:+ start:89 stop:466 length:378 start_codon:yes stop_codon:yes gene_type:complete